MITGFLRLLPHGAILICNMYIVFFLIDRVNTAMCFIDNDITKALLAIMCVISLGTSLALMRSQRRADAARERRARRQHREESNTVEHRKNTRKRAA